MTARCLGLVALPLAFALSAPALADPHEPTAPLDPVLQEAIERRLIQFEVRLSQKGVPLRGIKAEDLDIELGGKRLKSFVLDDMCTGAEAVTADGAAGPPGSFILYFDEIELTSDGRRRAVEVAKLVATTLLSKGNELKILRNRTSLQRETAWTRDAAEVAATLARIAGDPGEGDAMRAARDEARVLGSMDHAEALVREANLNQASSKDGASARTYQKIGDQAVINAVNELGLFVREEVRRGGRGMVRLRSAISSLALRGSPKGIVYFADTLRRDPGHVVQDMMESVPRFANRITPGTSLTDARLIPSVSSQTADFELAALVRDAAAYGARFFAVEGRNLAAPSDWIQSSQDTLVSLALDTGGLSFLNGIAPERIADRIAADQSCWYLASFDPKGWATDRPLGLGVYPKTRGVRVNTRSSLVIPSKETLNQAKLLAAPMENPVVREAMAVQKDP